MRNVSSVLLLLLLLLPRLGLVQLSGSHVQVDPKTPSFDFDQYAEHLCQDKTRTCPTELPL